ncbi:metal-dependent transcriptional regulator [Brevibacterium sp. 50QC2O2]|uniref:metal-dependent transcriptional regulator n=1 Tax=Brevibacterium TaxID=1696 RepID=UPI00211CAE22|nr:metal-dependent transcriptional regulator [Brevibacterium sp. 68QC2CO]MCQ9387774.1 metal-dependent transcriptional regulator [Brevibacterium sp. 50QC2O2]
MNDLVDTTEMYLKAIVELEEQGITPLRARIAERLDHSGPTVSQTVARMERDGLLIVDPDRRLELTEEGREHAMSVMRKHRLAERLLADVIDLDWVLIHDEACRWEHVMSDQVEEKLVKLLPNLQTGPYGNPIPGLDKLGVEAAAPEPVISLAAACGRTGADVEIAWFAEPLQVDHYLLEKFRQTGVMPGAKVSSRPEGEYITLSAPDVEDVLDLPVETATHVFVRPITA